MDDLRWFPPISPWSRRRRPLASNPVAYRRRLRKTIGFDRGLRGRFGIYLVANYPLSKWLITPVINGISRVNPLITGVITHLPSG